MIFNRNLVTLLSSIDECIRNIKHLDHAVQKMDPKIPFTAETYAGMSDDDIGNLDQFILRFTKLQDCLGNRLFRLVLDNIGEYNYGDSFLDIVHKLEKFSIIKFKQIQSPVDPCKKEHEWQYIRGIRNRLAHEYPEDARERIDATNESLKFSLRMFEIYTSAKNYITDKVLSQVVGLDLHAYELPEVAGFEILRRKFWQEDEETSVASSPGPGR